MAAARKRIAGDETVHHVSARKKRQEDRGAVSMQPPLTPMIDVVFQLLLFFLLACRFIPKEAQIQAKVPNLQRPQVIQVPPIKVALTPMGADGMGVHIAIENSTRPIGDFPTLHAMLVALCKRDGDSVPVLIQPRSDVAWEHAANAFNQAVRARFKNVAFQASQS